MDRFYLTLFLQGGLVTFFIICLLFLTGVGPLVAWPLLLLGWALFVRNYLS